MKKASHSFVVEDLHIEFIGFFGVIEKECVYFYWFRVGHNGRHLQVRHTRDSVPKDICTRMYSIYVLDVLVPTLLFNCR